MEEKPYIRMSWNSLEGTGAARCVSDNERRHQRLTDRRRARALPGSQKRKKQNPIWCLKEELSICALSFILLKDSRAWNTPTSLHVYMVSMMDRAERAPTRENNNAGLYIHTGSTSSLCQQYK